MKKARIVVVGTGLMGSVHCHIIHQLENCELYGISDIDVQKGSLQAEEYGVKFFPSVEEVGKDELVDGVIVCVPDRFHFPVCSALAKAGKNILVEKPIAPTAIESEKIKRICDENGVLLCVAQCTAFVDELRVAKQQYREGYLGEAVHLLVRHVDLWDFGETIWDTAEVMHYLGVHDVFDVLNVTGHKITKVISKKAPGKAPVYITLFTMDNGAIGTIEVGWDAAPTVGDQILQREFFGTKGTILMDLSSTKSNFITYGAEGKPNPNTAGGIYFDGHKLKGFLAYQDARFAECCMDRTQIFDVDTNMAIDAVRVIDAIFRSVESGKEEEVY